MSNDVKKGQNVPWNKMLVDYQNFLLVEQEVKEMFPVLLLCHGYSRLPGVSFKALPSLH